MKETVCLFTGPEDDRLLFEAICFAAEVHRGQVRKGGATPFIVHPMEAASIAATMTNDRRVIAAAVLHDVLEDTDTQPDVILSRFGRDVLSLIAGDTEDKREGLDPRDTWKTRKLETIEYVRTRATLREKMVILSDKLANLRSLKRDFVVCGDTLWDRFHQKDPAQHRWYYESVVTACVGLEDTAAFSECMEIIRDLFGSL